MLCVAGRLSLCKTAALVVQVAFCKETDDAAQRLGEYLIDEPLSSAATEGGTQDAARLGYADWVSHLEREVAQMLGESR